jgi:hypothetical protein
MQRREVRALFHDRDEMERAVRDLVDRGVRKRRIRVVRATETGRPVREGGSAMGKGGLIGAGLGLLAALLGLLSLPTAPPFFVAAFRLLAAAAGGALVGGLAGLIYDALRGRRRRDVRDVTARPPRDWLVRIRAAESEAPRVQRILDAHGGEPAPG